MEEVVCLFPFTGENPGQKTGGQEHHSCLATRSLPDISDFDIVRQGGAHVVRGPPQPGQPAPGDDRAEQGHRLWPGGC